MVERDYFVNYCLSMESQDKLFRKAENFRMAKLIARYKSLKVGKIAGSLGVVAGMLVIILFM